MSFVADIIAAGLDPLQNSDIRWLPQLRTIRMGMRIVDQDADGTFVMDRESIGDQLGWNLWNQVAGARPCPAWAQAWPAGFAQVPSGSGTTTMQAGVLPFGQLFRYNQEFGLKFPKLPRIGTTNRRAFPNPAGGTVGIVLSAVDTYAQDDLFMWTDPRLIAVNVRGLPSCGSIVSDLDEDSFIDPTRYARLQTIFRVVLPRMATGGVAGFVADTNNPGANLGAVALNLALTGQEGALGRGLVIDQASGTSPAPEEPPGVPTMDTPRPTPLPPGAGGPPPPSPPPGGGP